MHILVTRPEPGASETRAALEALGHRVSVAPLLAVELARDVAIDLNGVAGLIATSRNGLKALAGTPQLQEALRLPLFAVGPGTAAYARALGFSTVVEGAGAAEALAAAIPLNIAPGAGVLLHLAGEDKAYDIGADLRGRGYRVRAPAIYRTVPAAALPTEIATAIRDGAVDAVILMSPRTAEVYLALVGEAGLAGPASRLTYFCLSRGVAARLGALEGAATRVADHPNQDDMLALVARGSSQTGAA